MIGSKLNPGSIALYTEVDTLDGSGGASVAAWADAAGGYPEAVFLRWTNAGLAEVVVGDVGAGIPAQVYADGVLAGVLFGGREVRIAPGDSVWCELPRHLGALGVQWSILAPLSSASPVSVSITARQVETTGHVETYYLDDNIVRNAAGLPTSARRRFFATATARDNATPGEGSGAEIATVSLSWAYSGDGHVVTQRGGE